MNALLVNLANLPQIWRGFKPVPVAQLLICFVIPCSSRYEVPRSEIYAPRKIFYSVACQIHLALLGFARRGAEFPACAGMTVDVQQARIAAPVYDFTH